MSFNVPVREVVTEGTVEPGVIVLTEEPPPHPQREISNKDMIIA